jgi:Domain of unknown function (DUF6834), C-terminal domain
MLSNELVRLELFLKELLEDKEIIARCELLNRTYEFVRAANLKSEDREELQNLTGRKLAAGIFASMMNGTPMFLGLPKLDAFTVLNGKIFHFLHTKNHGKEDFHEAYRKFLASIPELKIIMLRNLKDLLIEFMNDADYDLVDERSQRLKFMAVGRKVEAKVFTSIKVVDFKKASHGRLENRKDRIIMVPSEENLEPFMQFYRQNAFEMEESGFQIWVANLEQGTIDPFIGYATDMDIYRQFMNPSLAQTIRTNWKR